MRSTLEEGRRWDPMGFRREVVGHRNLKGQVDSLDCSLAVDSPVAGNLVDSRLAARIQVGRRIHLRRTFLKF